ncbi:AMP-binding protein [Actinotalea solisilvae]|uniref:AMP-binding protein n=1 Tax=Actinotalea solisilvae TaxID=2072922 RepID=UPI0018F21F3B|nr:AMP-binding protein [Actinotalea solisilvae]
MTVLPVEALPLADLARHGDRPAVRTATGTLTYAELAARADDVARRLGTRRLVAVAALNDVGSLVAYLGALAGGHAVLLLPGDKPEAVDALVAAWDPDVVLRGRDAPGDDVVLDERRPGTAHDLHPDLALLLSTSGSTGAPKLVRLSRANLQANAEQVADALGVRPDDRAATTLPFHYSYGLSVVHSHLLRGATLVLTDLSVVDPCFWALAREAGVTTFAGVPYTFELLDRLGVERMDLPSLRYVTQAGGRLAPDAVRRWAGVGRERGWDLVVMYGQTEATARIAVLPPDLAPTRPGAVGRAVPGGSLRIEPVPGSPDGELVYEGPNVMLGYAESPADLALGRTVDVLRTGDLARLGPDGVVEVVGRRSRFLKVVGLRVDLGHVEAVLAGMGLTAAAAGRDERLVVAVEGALDAGLLGALLAERLALPRGAVVVHPVDALPRVASGKVDLAAVAALDAAVVTPPAEPDGPADVARIYAEELGLDRVPPDASFVDLGGDSLSYVATSVRLEAALGHLPADWHVTPVGALAGSAADAARPAGARRRRLLGAVETSVVLRAVAIVLIVGTHAKLFAWPGTAHVLVAVAGFNFARFQLVGDRTARLRRQLRSLARVVVPSVAFIAVAALLTGTYTLANVALVNALVGSPTWTPQWHFWFVEMLVYVLVGVVALLAVPWADRAERRFPLGFPVALLGVGLLTRFDLVVLPTPHPAPVLWLFALGWGFARARRVRERLALSAVVLLTVPGFFDDPRREAVIAVGLLLLAWLPTVPVPTALHRGLGMLASASLHVYLVHWLVYPDLATVHPALGVVASLAAGVGYWALVTHGPRAVRRARDRLPVSAGP